MQSKYRAILEMLSDNQFHSGQEIGRQLKITRAGVWKLIQHLQSIGFVINGISRKGYQLKHEVSFLCTNQIKLKLNKKIFKLIEVFETIDSTNDYLLHRMYEFSKAPRVCLAEQQTYGRGRNGRSWHSPYAQNIYLSLLWRVNHAHLQPISLIICLAVIRVLQHYDLPQVLELKWPNDIYYEGKKLGGVLIETSSELHATTQVVIGIGLNVNMIMASRKEINRSWTSLMQISDKVFERNQLVAMLLDTCVEYLQLYEEKGFSIFQNLWKKFDLCFGKTLRIDCQGMQFDGVGAGVDIEGRMKINSKTQKLSFSVGEINTTN